MFQLHIIHLRKFYMLADSISANVPQIIEIYGTSSFAPPQFV